MLRITKQTDYAIVLMSCLSARRGADGDAVHTARDLASIASLPMPTVSKILKAMTRAGLVESRRGVKGGYSLARSASEIAVVDVVEALEGPIAITECLDETSADCGIEGCCPTRVNWQRVNGAVREALLAIPLSEMTTFHFPPAVAQATETEA
ncbi:MAG: SUF system Fe-S cluster assembly regulator [Planctomycetota bacterium]|jgi:FeS assembly SUF system regulator